jgi:hypothetical protein
MIPRRQRKIQLARSPGDKENHHRMKHRARSTFLKKLVLLWGAFFGGLSTGPLLAAHTSAVQNVKAQGDTSEPPLVITQPTADSILTEFPVQLGFKLGSGVNPTVLQVTLNGQDISYLFDNPWFQGRQERSNFVRPGQGLIPGNNVLKVRILGAGQLNATVMREFSVQASFLKADAGPDSQHRTGEPVTLNGSKSGGSGGLGAVPIRYQWELISRPMGSQAQLNDPTAPKPTFTPDKSGTYMAKLVVTDGANVSEADTVSVYVLDSPDIHTVQTLNGNGNIEVDNQEYPGQGGVNVVTFDRATFALVYHTVLTDSPGAQSYLKAVATSSQPLIVIMSSSSPPPFALADVSSELQALGATNEFGNGLPGLSFVGATGLPAGQGFQAGSAVNLTGSFVRDSQNNFTFTQFDYVPFTITPSHTLIGASIQIGAKTYNPVQPTDGTAAGGFQVVVVDRANPGTLLSNKTYYTYDTANGLAQIAAMQADLTPLWNDESKLIFVTTFGTPVFDPSPLRLVWQRLHSIGGTYDLLNDLKPTDTYALVGTASPAIATITGVSLYQGPEASTVLGQSGVLKGVLGRGHRGNWYAPVASAFNADLDLGLYDIVGQPAQNWSFPVGDEQQAAYAWISKQICPSCQGDVRLSYGNLNHPVQTLYNNLNNLSYPNGPPGFTEGAFNTVKQQWLAEMNDVENIEAFETNLATLWTDNQANRGLTINTVAHDVKQAVKPPPASKAQLISDLLKNTLLGFAEQAVTDFTGIPLGLVQFAFDAGTILAKQPSGASATDKVEAEVQNLETAAKDSFNQQLYGLQRMFAIIYQDSSKIHTLSQDLQSNNAQWTWTSSTTVDLLNVIEPAEELSYYQSLMATVYAVREMVLYYGQDPTKGGDFSYCSYDFINSCEHPYDNWPAEAVTTSPTWVIALDPFVADVTGPRQAIPFLTSLTSDTGRPNTGLLQKLFSPVSQGGYGVWKPYLLRRWPFQRFYCVEQADTGTGFNGCDTDKYGAVHITPIFPEELGPSGWGQPVP